MASQARDKNRDHRFGEEENDPGWGSVSKFDYLFQWLIYITISQRVIHLLFGSGRLLVKSTDTEAHVKVLMQTD